MFEKLSFQNVVFWHKSSRGGVVLSVRVCVRISSWQHEYFGRDIPKVVKVRHWTMRGLTLLFHTSTFSEQFLRHIRVVLTWHARLRSVLSEDLFWESREFVFPLVFSQVSRSLFQNLEKRFGHVVSLRQALHSWRVGSNVSARLSWAISWSDRRL